jgi:transposase
MFLLRNDSNLTFCRVCEVNYCLPIAPCDRCQQPSPFFTTAERSAIDLNLEHPVLLQVTVSVHHCSLCHHYFRAQPPFLRRDAIYTNRVVDKAVQSVYEDGMAMRRVSTRMARDFWVRPSEGVIRGWCRTFGAGFDFEADYQAWVVGEFSGILCVDEVYQDRLALLLAVDPAAQDGDRLVGYQLVHGTVNGTDVEHFLRRLKNAGIEPAEVVTDGSSLYPGVLAQVWPNVAHQLCLFHETRRVTKAAMKAIQAIRKNLPHLPPTAWMNSRGPLRDHPPRDDLTDPATQRWYWRQMQRHVEIGYVHQLAQQGLSQRAIARQAGHHRRTIKDWLSQPAPALPEGMPVELSEYASLPEALQRQQKKRQLRRQVHDLAGQGLSYSAIARHVGIHRVTIKKWLQQGPAVETEGPTVTQPDIDQAPPPAPWSDWDQVRQVQEALQEHRFLFLRRPENLIPEEKETVASLLAGPVGAELQIVYSFLGDWYDLWTDEHGQRRSLTDAQARFEAWRTNPAYQAVPPLKRVQEQMTSVKFEHLSQFLRHPDWEATNNGAERAGRAFRHRQAPHFNLRKQEFIEQAITVAACQRKEAAMQPPPQPFHTCQRGRKRRQESDTASPTLFVDVRMQGTHLPRYAMAI